MISNASIPGCSATISPDGRAGILQPDGAGKLRSCDCDARGVTGCDMRGDLRFHQIAVTFDKLRKPVQKALTLLAHDPNRYVARALRQSWDRIARHVNAARLSA